MLESYGIIRFGAVFFSNLLITWIVGLKLRSELCRSALTEGGETGDSRKRLGKMGKIRRALAIFDTACHTKLASD